MKNSLRPFLRTAAVVALVTATACSPIMRHHGYVPTQNDFAQLQLGKQTRAEVLDLLPAPTAEGVMEGGNLYYVASSFRTLGPLAPREVSREVVAVSFDKRGILSGVERFGLENGRVIPLSRRITPGSVTDMSFIRQLMGNVGRFDPTAFLDRN